MNTPKTNPKNDRIKREYLVWLKEAKQRSPSTVEQVRHAIDRLEVYTGYKDFATFNKDQAIAFKQALMASTTERTGKPVSLATVHHTLQAIKDFLGWLQGQSNYRRRIKPADIAYLSLTMGEIAQAHTTAPKAFPSVDDYHAAIFAMPTGTETQRRDQALMAFLLSTAMRDGALVGAEAQTRIDETRVAPKLRSAKKTCFSNVMS